MTDKDPYLKTVGRMETNITMIDAGAYYASAAISLKRIADALEKIAEGQRPYFTMGSVIEDIFGKAKWLGY